MNSRRSLYFYYNNPNEYNSSNSDISTENQGSINSNQESDDIDNESEQEVNNGIEPFNDAPRDNNINNQSDNNNQQLPRNKPKKKYRSEVDIPVELSYLFSQVKSCLIGEDDHVIEEFDMHCMEIHKDEKGKKRWKLKCTLCQKEMRVVDYFLSHRGSGCPLYSTIIHSRNLDSFLDPPSTPQELLLERLAILAASCNISSRQIASPEFKVFLRFLLDNSSTIRAAHLVYRDKDVTHTILCIYNKIKASLMQKTINEQLPMFLQIDAGKNGNIHTYQILLCNPGHIRPFPYKSIEANVWSGHDFFVNIRQCILELLDKHIVIAAITGDNAAAQLSALDPCSRNSIQYSELCLSSPNSNICSLLFFPCLAHTTDLALDDADGNEDFEAITEAKRNLYMFHSFFQDNEVRKIIGRYNISICEKQWIFMIKPAISLLKKTPKIMHFLQNAPPELIEQYPDANLISLFHIYQMVNLLLPLQNYVELLERDNTCLWQVEPALQYLIDELSTRGDIYHINKEADFLIKCIQNRNLITSKKELMITAYYLTPIGFYKLSNSNEYDDTLKVWKVESANEIFDEIDLHPMLANPDDWGTDFHHISQIRNHSYIQHDVLEEEDQSDIMNENEIQNENETQNENEISNEDQIQNENEIQDENEISFTEFIHNTEIARDKWSQIKLIQIENLTNLVAILETISNSEFENSAKIDDCIQFCLKIYPLFLKNLLNVFIVVDDFIKLNNNLSQTSIQGFDDIENLKSDIQEKVQVIESGEFVIQMINDTSQIIQYSCKQFDGFINQIPEQELSFIQPYDENNSHCLAHFIEDESFTFINERLERYTNGLKNLVPRISCLYQDITIFSSNISGPRLWPDITNILSSTDPMIIAHYVIRNLAELNKLNDAIRLFEIWKPGQNDAVEREIFLMHKFDPVTYWNKLSKSEKWRPLAEIALRIISIPPTEAACERIFSARREIMTKHINNIRDSVVEARAHLKSGLYQIVE